MILFKTVFDIADNSSSYQPKQINVPTFSDYAVGIKVESNGETVQQPLNVTLGNNAVEYTPVGKQGDYHVFEMTSTGDETEDGHYRVNVQKGYDVIKSGTGYGKGTSISPFKFSSWSSTTFTQSGLPTRWNVNEIYVAVKTELTSQTVTESDLVPITSIENIVSTTPLPNIEGAVGTRMATIDVNTSSGRFTYGIGRVGNKYGWYRCENSMRPLVEGDLIEELNFNGSDTLYNFYFGFNTSLAARTYYYFAYIVAFGKQINRTIEGLKIDQKEDGVGEWKDGDVAEVVMSTLTYNVYGNYMELKKSWANGVNGKKHLIYFRSSFDESFNRVSIDGTMYSIIPEEPESESESESWWEYESIPEVDGIPTNMGIGYELTSLYGNYYLIGNGHIYQLQEVLY